MTGLRTAVIVLCVVALGATAALAELELPRVSPNASVSQTVGTTQMTLTYSRPGVKGRVIWGELVPFGEIWRTGANEATKLVITDDVTVNDNPLAAGSYSLATIPGKDEWTVVFNTQDNLWGMYEHDASKDALRITVKPQEASFVERMRFTFDNLTDESADVVLRWEKLQLSFTVKVDAVGTTLARARKEIAVAAADDWRTPYRAAMYCIQSGMATDEVKGWIDRAVSVESNYSTLGGKARYLAAKGQTGEAIAVARKAVELGKAAGSNTSALERLIAEWGEK